MCLYSTKLYIRNTISRSSALSNCVLFILLMQIYSISCTIFNNGFLIYIICVSIWILPVCTLYSSLHKYLRVTVVRKTSLEHRSLELDLIICVVCFACIINHFNWGFCSFVVAQIYCFLIIHSWYLKCIWNHNNWLKHQ